jgi:hypothetical protein
MESRLEGLRDLCVWRRLMLLQTETPTRRDAVSYAPDPTQHAEMYLFRLAFVISFFRSALFSGWEGKQGERAAVS